MNVIETLKKHEREIKEKYGVRRIGVFGSYVRGGQGEESDIDILVEFDEPTFDNFMNLSFYLEGLFRRKVDLVTTKGLSPYISPIVEKEVVWCE
ncbi:MAG: nucleotidyltransferase domain-containing protein [Candidatus Bathyarchaeota archaeon B26-2]|nr:MAG: nucleotidyltransferase domain-containing protein [Candidatus Bathyarchaeota archaeon B26-2]